MNRTTPAIRLWASLVFLILGRQSASAQVTPQTANPTATQATSALTSHYVKTGLYMISGGGGNSVLRLSGNGLILVDGKRQEHFEELLLRIKKIVDQPIRVVINTDASPQHTGTNGQFLADKIQVLAQQNVKQSLESSPPGDAKLTPPSATYAQDQLLTFGLVEVRLMHFGPARTNGDTVVYFPDLKAVAVGDLYSPHPQLNDSSGGSLAGWSKTLGEILKLDFDVAIPGEGPTVTRTEMEACKAKIDALLAHAG